MFITISNQITKVEHFLKSPLCLGSFSGPTLRGGEGCVSVKNVSVSYIQFVTRMSLTYSAVGKVRLLGNLPQEQIRVSKEY